MFRTTTMDLASMLTALYCVTMIQSQIHQLFQGRACTKLTQF